MNAVATWLLGVSILFVVALAVDAILARRHPLTASALWNAVLAAAIALPAAAWWLPQWELPLLPAAQPITRTAESLEWVKVDHAGNVVAVPPPPMVPRQEAGPHALPVPSRPATAFDPLPVESKPRWPNWRIDLGTSLAVLYTGGLIVLLLQLTANLWAVKRLRQRAQPVVSTIWLARFEHWRRHVAPWRAVALLKSDAVSVPIVLGSWRPAVLVPAGLAEETDTSLIDAILVHELAHVERADCFWQLVERLVQGIYWFHPLVWLASRRIAAVRERACDEFAIHALADREAYVETLIEMATRLSRRQRLGLAMAVVRTTKLERRLAAIEHSEGQPRCKSGRLLGITMVCGLLAAMTASLSLRIVRAEATPPAASEKPATPQSVDPFVLAVANDSKPRPTRIDMREMMRKWIPQLTAADYAAFAGSFDAKLQEALPPEKLAEAIAELENTYGPLKLIRDRWNRRRYGITTFDIMKLQFERAELELRLVVDKENGEISSLWIAPFEGPEAPANFDLAKYGFGAAAEEARRATLSLSAEALDADGRKVNARFDLYAAPEVGATAEGRDLDSIFPLGAFEGWHRIAQGETVSELLPGRYRVTAYIPSERNSWDQTPFGMSEIVELKEGGEKSHVVVRLERGSTLVVRAVDADTGQTLDDVTLSLRRASDDFPPDWQAHPETAERLPGVYTFDELPAGQYELVGKKSAHSPSDVERKPAEPRVLVDMQPDKNQELSVKFKTKRLDDAAIAKNWPWVATGRVTDPAGKPIAGATVHAATGMFTLLGSSTTTTDIDGRYVLRFTQGMGISDPVSLQAALIGASKPGYFETNLNRQGGLTMALKTPSEVAAKHWGSRGVFLPNEPREVNFTLARAARLTVTLTDARNKELADARVQLIGEQAPGGSAVAPGTTNGSGRFTFPEVPLNFTWSIGASVENVIAGEKGLGGRSQAFELAEPREYHATLRLRHDEEEDVDLVELLEFKSEGRDVQGEVLRDDPIASSPLTGERKAEALEILEKVKAANKAWWFAEPPQDVKTIIYDFVFAESPAEVPALARDLVFGDSNRHRYAFRRDTEIRGGVDLAHGLSYSPAAAAVCWAPEKFVLRTVKIEPTGIRIGYTAKENVGFTAGNGVSGSWRGFVSGRISEGVLIIDPQRWVPLQNTFNRDDREEFQDYRKLPDGTWAPGGVKVFQNGKLSYDWKFKIYEPGVWLFAKSENLEDPAAAPIATLENIEINGQPAKRLP